MFKSYSFADLKALINELKQRLNEPLFVVHFDEYRMLLTSATKEIDNRIHRLIHPPKANAEKTLPEAVTNRFIEIFNQYTGHSLRTIDDKAKKQLQKIMLVEHYALPDFEKAIKTAFKDMTLRETVKHLTPEFITRPAQFSKYLNMKTELPKKVLSL